MRAPTHRCLVGPRAGAVSWVESSWVLRQTQCLSLGSVGVIYPLSPSSILLGKVFRLPELPGGRACHLGFRPIPGGLSAHAWPHFSPWASCTALGQDTQGPRGLLQDSDLPGTKAHVPQEASSPACPAGLRLSCSFSCLGWAEGRPGNVY